MIDAPTSPTSRVILALCALAFCGLLFGVYVGVHHVSAPAPTKPSFKALSAPKPFTFPDGGRELAGQYRFVALYGSPDNSVLGVLGEQPPEAAAQRIKSIASEYQPLSAQPVYPSFEIITTIASSGPTDNGDYSQELDPGAIAPWIKIARDQGVYVVLDLQPGRTDFLTQAKQYESLLLEPNVGLALDPEWRLVADQVPLHQIGSVSAAEVNATARWLADLTAGHKLPQKLLVLHQFRLDMLPDRDQIDTARRELAYIIQMDGQGGQPAKLDTYRTITAVTPPNVVFGWKNFYRQDLPTLDPAGTMQLSPTPWYISYQ